MAELPGGEAAAAVRSVFETLRELIKDAEAQQRNRPAMGVRARGVGYCPPGLPRPLLQKVDFDLEPNTLGLIYGKSGSGKSTLLQILAGLTEVTDGSIAIARPDEVAPAHMRPSERSARAGLVFQFPERHFIGDSIQAELTLTWPRTVDLFTRQVLTQRLLQALSDTGFDLNRYPLSTDPRTLSDGYKRRLALATQLVRGPGVLLMDEPLAGLDWVARAELVRLLRSLKGSCTLLVVSHDICELAPLVDRAWEMLPGGELAERPADGLLGRGPTHWHV